MREIWSEGGEELNYIQYLCIIRIDKIVSCFPLHNSHHLHAVGVSTVAVQSNVQVNDRKDLFGLVLLEQDETH